MQALQGEPDVITTLRSLKSKTVVFTGPLLIRREDAAILVFQAGGKVGRKVSVGTDVLVIGGRGHYDGGGHKGLKLKTALQINKTRPKKIALIGEADFRRLVRKAS